MASKLQNKAKYLELDLVASISTIRVQFIYVYSSTYYVIILVIILSVFFFPFVFEGRVYNLHAI